MKDCDVCGNYCYPKQFNWAGKILCLDCFLWCANRHIVDELIPIEEYEFLQKNIIFKILF